MEKRQKEKEEFQKKRSEQYDLKTINIKNQKKDLESQLEYYKNLLGKK